MSDQYKQNDQIQTEPVMPETISSVPPPPTPLVVVSTNNKVPTWFYLLFGLVICAFIAMTTLLVLTIRGKGLYLPQAPSLSPITPAPTSIATPTLVPSPAATEAAILNLIKLSEAEIPSSTKLSESDEIADLEADVKNTDLSTISESLEALDRQMGFSSQP